METNSLEKILKKDVRYKHLEKREKILEKRLEAGMKNKKALYERIYSIGQQAYDIQELEDQRRVNASIELLLILDRMKSILVGVSFEPKELDGLPSAAIDRYIARQESVTKQHEEAMTKAEAAQARITELLDALG